MWGALYMLSVVPNTCAAHIRAALDNFSLRIVFLRMSLCLLFIMRCAALMRTALHAAHMDHSLFIVCTVIIE